MPAIQFDATSFIAQAKAFANDRPKMNMALLRAVNRAGDMAFTKVRRELAAATGIKQSDMNRSRGLAKVPAKADRLEYRVVARSQTTPLSYFAPTQRTAGVSAKPWNQRRIFPGTFIVRLSSGHDGVFRRVGQQRVARISPTTGRRYWSQGTIKELWGPSLAKEMLKPPIPEVFSGTLQTNLPARLNHEVDRVLGALRRAA